MARISGVNTTPELIVRRLLWASGLRYRIHARTPGGRPDLVFTRQKMVVYIDGCFWHGCPDHYVRPQSRQEFWDRKLSENVERDRKQVTALVDAGWRVLRFWEHEVRQTPVRVTTAILACAQGGPRRYRPAWRVVRVHPDPARDGWEIRLLSDLHRPGATRVERGPRTTQKLGRVRRERTVPAASNGPLQS